MIEALCKSFSLTGSTLFLVVLTGILLVGTAAQNVTNTMCGVKPALDESWIVPTIVLLCLMIVVVAMRVLARAIVDMPFWWDDWMSFISMVSKLLIHIVPTEF